MLVSRKIGVLITKKYFIMFPCTYLIFHLNQFQILGETNACLFHNFFGLSTTTIWQKKRISEFSTKNKFCPIASYILHLKIVPFNFCFVQVTPLFRIPFWLLRRNDKNLACRGLRLFCDFGILEANLFSS